MLAFASFFFGGGGGGGITSHGSPMLVNCYTLETNQLGSMGYMYGYYQSWVSHVGNRRCEHRATETDLVVLLFVRIFVGGRILSMKRLQ